MSIANHKMLGSPTGNPEAPEICTLNPPRLTGARSAPYENLHVRSLSGVKSKGAFVVKNCFPFLLAALPPCALRAAMGRNSPSLRKLSAGCALSMEHSTKQILTTKVTKSTKGTRSRRGVFTTKDTKSTKGMRNGRGELTMKFTEVSDIFDSKLRDLRAFVVKHSLSFLLAALPPCALRGEQESTGQPLTSCPSW
jgi:hypothetical protein